MLDHAFRIRRGILQATTPLGGPIKDLLGLFHGQNLQVNQLNNSTWISVVIATGISCSRNLGAFTLTAFPAAVAPSKEH
jgi:hypothetical protein